MAKLLMNLRGVGDDEAEEVRALLEAHRIDYYETPPNRWGISQGGIWLREPDQLAEARRLLARYQEERSRRIRAEHEAQRRSGELETVAQRLVRDPVRGLLYLALVAAVLALTLLPFLRL